MIVRDSPVPMYKQLSKIINDQITSGELKNGSKIGSVNELMIRYGIGRVTVVNALEDLVEKGLIISKQGKGSYVRPQYYNEQLSTLRSFKQINNLEADEVTEQILFFEYINTPSSIKDQFPEEKKVLMIGRLHIQRNTPIAYVNIYLPQDIAAGIVSADVNKSSIYEVLENKNILVEEALQNICAESAKAPITDILQVEKGFPLLVNERTSFDLSNRVLMVSKFYYRHDAYSFMVRLQRAKNL
ncbi:GntR family transcriptional regulator [Sporosarcina sp. FA9]|uniref:GntR family transcriptional regulator n=1 Tax=Sporosarcina sp. FA9 TaxID=3413030 RepID=UPI003F65FB69